MTRIFLLILLSMIFISCKKGTSNIYGLHTYFDIAINNQEGQNFLEKNTNVERVIVFGENKGKQSPASLAQGESPDSPRTDTVFIRDRDGGKILSIGFIPIFVESSIEIKWEGLEKPDTLTSNLYFDEQKNIIVSRDLYFNGTKVWDENSNVDRSKITIVK